MPKLIVLQGLPASGKSTKADEIKEKSRGKTMIIRRDTIYALIGNNKSKVDACEEKMITEGLQRQFDVIVDATNLQPDRMELMHQYAADSGASIETLVIDTPPEECVKRDKLRIGPAHVGAPAIWSMYHKYLKE